MKSLLNRIHASVGDLWWYSAPKYVGPNELGAVPPLQQFTSFLTVLILASGFVAALGQLVGSTLQGQSCWRRDTYWRQMICFDTI